MFGLFKKKPLQTCNEPLTTETASAHPGPESRHSTHQSLLVLLDVLQTAASNQQFDQIRTSIKEFSSVLRGHLLSENIGLYVYISSGVDKDEAAGATILSLRQEITRIDTAMNAFLEYYEGDHWSVTKEQNFPGDLNELGGLLIRRMTYEDTIRSSMQSAQKPMERKHPV